jgi:hypothetical protein
MKRLLTVLVLSVLTLTVFSPRVSAGPILNAVRDARQRAEERRSERQALRQPPAPAAPQAAQPPCPCPPYCGCCYTSQPTCGSPLCPWPQHQSAAPAAAPAKKVIIGYRRECKGDHCEIVPVYAP